MEPLESVAVASDILVAGSRGTNFISGSFLGGVRMASPVRTREGSDSQHVRFVKAGHGIDGGYRQFVLGERTGLIRAEYLDARRFIYSREPGWKNAQLRLSLCSERGRKGKRGR